MKNLFKVKVLLGVAACCLVMGQVEAFKLLTSAGSYMSVSAPTSSTSVQTQANTNISLGCCSDSTFAMNFTEVAITRSSSHVHLKYLASSNPDVYYYLDLIRHNGNDYDLVLAAPAVGWTKATSGGVTTYTKSGSYTSQNSRTFSMSYTRVDN